MDLNRVAAFVRDPALSDWRAGDAWLAGGTYLFSEPQPAVTRLLDLTTLGWPALVATPDGLEIAATCTVAELYSWEAPPEWTIGPLVRRCCEAFLASFKIWNEATVGGNLCNALPAGPMISLTAALGGMCLIQGPSGERTVSVSDFVVGDNRHALLPGEWLRSIRLPAAALSGRTAFRRQSLNTHGRSAVLLIGRMDDEGWQLTITASVKRPVQVDFPGPISAAQVREAVLQAVPDQLWHDDVHGLPAWRRHLTLLYAEEIRRELTP